MAHRYNKHYTREEARALLPQVRVWLKQLNEKRAVASKYEERLKHLMLAGHDAGGDTVNQFMRAVAALLEISQEFNRREIQIKDPDRGLLDFPSLIAGREVFLCWEQDEDDIEFWHEIDTGYAGRERL
jgi:hypothetical protein